MNFIGSIIEEYRSMNNMSRRELSEGICSEKYIYLIETNKRTPSANLIKLISDKLGVDLFSYYEYLDCSKPILVKKYIDNFALYRSKFEPQLLCESTSEAIRLQDFNKTPWKYEIRINEFFISIYIRHEYKKTIIEINKFFDEIELKYSKGSYVANVYILLAVCYIFLGDLINAKNATLSAYEVMLNKSNIRGNEVTITSIKITIMTLSYLLEDNERVIREAKEILEYKYKIESSDRLHYAYFYLAFAQYKTNLHVEAIENFKKGIHICLIDNKLEDVKHIAMQDVFIKLVNDERVGKEIVEEFYKKYNIAV